MNDKNTQALPGIDLDLDKLEALAKAATPGPWKAKHNNVFAGGRYRVCNGVTAGGSAKGMIDERQWEIANATFIAAANPQTVLALIAQARAARTSGTLNLDTTASANIEALRQIGQAWMGEEGRDALDDWITATLAPVAAQQADEKQERMARLGHYVTSFATKAGWDANEGEGAFEYVQRISYEQGFADRGRSEYVAAKAPAAQAMPGDWTVEWESVSSPTMIRLNSPTWGGCFLPKPPPGDIALASIFYYLLADMLAASPASTPEASQQAAAVTAPSSWRGLSDSAWMNIVNHDHAYRNFGKEEAVHDAVKRTEAKLKEINTAPTAAAATTCEDAWNRVVVPAKLRSHIEHVVKLRKGLNVFSALGIAIDGLESAMRAIQKEGD